MQESLFRKCLNYSTPMRQDINGSTMQFVGHSLWSSNNLSAFGQPVHPTLSSPSGNQYIHLYLRLRATSSSSFPTNPRKYVHPWGRHPMDTCNVCCKEDPDPWEGEGHQHQPVSPQEVLAMSPQAASSSMPWAPAIVSCSILVWHLGSQFTQLYRPSGNQYISYLTSSVHNLGPSSELVSPPVSSAPSVHLP